MNDDGTLYLLLEDTVYAIDVNMGKMDVAYKDLNSSNCTASGDGIFVMCDGGDENAGPITDMAVQPAYHRIEREPHQPVDRQDNPHFP
jgi:hypothetical protein